MFEEKVTISVEVLETAELQIITTTTVTKDGNVISSKPHYDVIQPGGDVSMWPEQIQKVAAATWTPENIAPVTAQVVEAIAVQQAAITEAAAKKAEAEAAAAQEIEDAKARETAANEAKALAEAAEAAAKEAQAKADAALKAAAALAAPPPEPVDACIDNLQIRLALNAAGLRDSVEAAVAASDQSVKDWWAYAKRFLRHNPMVLAMGQALGQTDEQLDQLWALAATL